MQWDSGQYLRFAHERTQPSLDLAGRIPLDNPRKVLDMGCGPGNSTAVLARRFPGAEILGVDSSPDMIEAARRACPQCRFLLADAGRDIGAFPADADIVFSNACIQWIPDHRRLLSDWMGLLAPGGVLAVQVPVNENEPMHRILRETAGSNRWRGRFPVSRNFYTLEPREYADLLSPLSRELTLWQTTYYHRLPSHGAIGEWMRGTSLRPYLQALPEEERDAFEQEIVRQLPAHYPSQEDGTVLFPFPRFFIVAVK